MTIIVTQPNTRVSNTTGVADNPALRIVADGVEFTNTGTGGLSSSTHDIATVVIDGVDATILNAGYIGGGYRFMGDTSGDAIRGSAGRDTVVNTGRIVGAVALGDGADTFVERGTREGATDMGTGNDLYQFEESVDRLRPDVDGGGGSDTINILNFTSFFNFVDGSNVRGFETLTLGANVSVSGFSGLSSIGLTTFAYNLFENCVNPNVDLTVGDRSFVGVMDGSSFRSITGGENGQGVELFAGASIGGAVRLGSGDDSLALDYAGTNGAIDVAGAIDGGDGADSIAFLGTGVRTIDLARFTGFEELVIAGYESPSDARIVHGSTYSDFSVGEGARLTIASTDAGSAYLDISDRGSAALEADASIGNVRYRYADFDSLARYPNRDPEAAQLLHNDGKVLGDVWFGFGDDVYDGTGTVGGTIYGFAGNDRIASGSGSEHIDGGYGDDTIAPGRGYNVVAGGDGNDMLVLTGTRADYSIIAANGGTYLVGRGEATFATGIETIRFADQQVAFADYAAAAPRFDGLRYIAGHGDLRQAFGEDAAAATQHFVQYGFAEHRDALAFDALAYTAAYGDLIRAFGTDEAAATRHYIEHGAAEGRLARFDGLDYIASYGDLIQALGADAVAGARHFIQYGFDEGRRTRFDPLAYGATNTDLARTIGDDREALATHYIEHGFAERRPTAGFDAVGYLLSNGDLGAARIGVGGALEHWLDYGADEGRFGDALFGREQTGHNLADGANAGRFDTGIDHDWFAALVPGNTAVGLTFTSSVAAKIELHGSDGHLIATGQVSGAGATAHIDYQQSAADIYLVSVYTLTNNPGTYTIDY